MTHPQGYGGGTTSSERLLTVDDLRSRLRISRTGVYRLIRSNALSPIYLDDRPRFRVEDIERLIDERTKDGR